MSSSPIRKKAKKIKTFRYQWMDMNPSWRTWVKPVPHDASKYFCLLCNKAMNCGYSEISRHESSDLHQRNADKQCVMTTGSGSEASTCYAQMPDFDFADRVKLAEIRIATFFVEHNIAYSTSSALLDLFKSIGEEPSVLQAVKLGRLKLSKIVNNVICREETRRLTETLQNNKFSVFVDETSDIRNDKWFSVMVRFIEPSTLDVQARLLQLINLDAKDCSAEKLFSAFNNDLLKKQIPLGQIIAVGCDNASVIMGRKSSFRTKLLVRNINIKTVPCICHSSALAAAAACKEIPSSVEELIKNIAAFINSSPKKTAIFRDFQKCFAQTEAGILKLAETRWLSRHNCIERILKNWDVLNSFLLEQASENNKQATELHKCMQNVETKAYLHFLDYTLNKFNSFNAEFQARETKIHLLQPKSMDILIFFASNFLKPALIKHSIFHENFRNTNFSKPCNIMEVKNINVDSDCEEYLQDMIHADSLEEMKYNDIKTACLRFLIKAVEEIRSRFPVDNELCKNLTILNHTTALFDSDREASAVVLLKINNAFGITNEQELKDEWLSLFNNESANDKMSLSKLHFDEMWIKICSQLTCYGKEKYPNLKKVLNIVRSLPHSNAEAERCFSIIPDVKSKKRNRTNSLTMPLTKRHLNLFESSNLYGKSYFENERSLTLHSKNRPLTIIMSEQFDTIKNKLMNYYIQKNKINVCLQRQIEVKHVRIRRGFSGYTIRIAELESHITQTFGVCLSMSATIIHAEKDIYPYKNRSLTFT
ncbi:protein FAM200A-like [Prorops nasuta]|uniref:protein FAM200A-like n=1 Tax=Prorops nasuta TaxID=863751 RepID=UPI0034CEF5EC